VTLHQVIVSSKSVDFQLSLNSGDVIVESSVVLGEVNKLIFLGVSHLFTVTSND